MRKFISIGVLGIVFLSLGIAIGIYIQQTYLASKFLPPKQVRQTGAYKYTNPLLECDVGDQLETEVVPFKSKLKSIVDSIQQQYRVDSISVYFRDIDNGPWFGIHEGMNFSPSSLLKVPLLMAYLEESEDDPTILDKKIAYSQELSYDDLQDIKSPMNLEVGKSYSVRELLEMMTSYSSNNASFLLNQNILPVKVNDIYQALGLPPPVGTVNNYQLTVPQYASFFRVLYNSSYLSRKSSEATLEMLTHTAFKDGLVAGVPGNIEIAHKFGERHFVGTDDVQLHDCGIVYYPKSPYLLCVMTRGKDFGELSSAIANISKNVYQIVDTQFSHIK